MKTSDLKTSDTGLALIRESEGCVLQAYPDPGSGGEPWTIGIGHTGGVRPGDTCSEAQAMAWLRADVVDAENGVSRTVRVPLGQHQFDALVSFTFNLGAGALASSTLLRRLNDGDTAGASAQFPRWVKAGSRTLPGLVKRRARERRMFDGGDWREIV